MCFFVKRRLLQFNGCPEKNIGIIDYNSLILTDKCDHPVQKIREPDRQNTGLYLLKCDVFMCIFA